jgi:hypothetical protein
MVMNDFAFVLLKYILFNAMKLYCISVTGKFMILPTVHSANTIAMIGGKERPCLCSAKMHCVYCNGSS